MESSSCHSLRHGLLDETALDKIRALQRPGRPDILHNVINRYLDHSPMLLEQLRLAVAATHSESIYRVAHSLKSASATLGAGELAATCADLEHMGREQSLDKTAELFSIIEHQHRAVVNELKTRLKLKSA